MLQTGFFKTGRRGPPTCPRGGDPQPPWGPRDFGVKKMCALHPKKPKKKAKTLTLAGLAKVQYKAGVALPTPAEGGHPPCPVVRSGWLTLFWPWAKILNCVFFVDFGIQRFLASIFDASDVLRGRITKCAWPEPGGRGPREAKSLLFQEQRKDG